MLVVGGDVADAGVQALHEDARAGLKEYELAAIVELHRKPIPSLDARAERARAPFPVHPRLARHLERLGAQAGPAQNCIVVEVVTDERQGGVEQAGEQHAAERAGLHSGDLVVAVNGAALVGETRRYAEARCRFAAGIHRFRNMPLPDEIARPKRLMDAMRYSSLGGGKRLRPFLVVESSAVFGVPRVREDDAARAVSAAAEIVENFVKKLVAPFANLLYGSINPL